VAEGNPVNRNMFLESRYRPGYEKYVSMTLLIKLTAGCALPQQLPILLDYY